MSSYDVIYRHKDNMSNSAVIDIADFKNFNRLFVVCVTFEKC